MNRLRAHLGPLWPYIVLIAIPAGGFVLPDLIGGRLLIDGDNLQQNYPLHVLVGSMFRNGELPTWNQYIFSGSPLMADFNAGAFHPLMAFFVVLPDRAAWLATEVFLFAGIGIGMYVFLRALRLTTWACLLGAATFSLAGPVLSQVNHVDMTEGFLAIPWMLLAVHHIVRNGRWRWSILLGVAFATVILAGAPEAMLDEALLVIAYAGVSAGLDRERWWRVLTRCASAAALALSLAAIQWLPGLEAIRNSQRGSGVFAAAGSFPTPFTIFSLVPYLDGGYGHLREAMFFGQYNLPEAGIYLGILPMIALITMVYPRWPSRLAPRDRLTWYAVGLFGLLLALGSNTPLEHLFNSLPLYGNQRLQSRNMITVATAVCVLFAGWLDRSDQPQPHDRFARYDRITALVPLALVGALTLWALTATGSLVHLFAGVWASPNVTGTVREAAWIALAFCAGAALVVWIRPWLRALTWWHVAAAFVAIDLGLMAVTSQLTQTPPNELVAGTTPVQQLMAKHLPPGGRMVNYDPQTYSSYPYSPQGVPDLNIVPELPSISGYASIVNGNYESVTHTHEQDDLDIGQLASGTLDRLELQEVVSIPEYFLVPLQSEPRAIGDAHQVSEGFGSDPVLARGFGANYNSTPYPFYPGPRHPLRTGETASWFFGESLAPSSASALFTTSVTTDTFVRFGILTIDGATRWGRLVSVRAGATRVSSRLPSGPAVGLSLQAFGPLPAQESVIDVAGHPYQLGGSLSSALTPGPWQLAGLAQGYAVFSLRRSPTPISAETATGHSLPVRIVSKTTKSEEVEVDTLAAATVIRSVAWDSGWRGSVSVNGGKPVDVAVNAFQLVQAIHIPAGRDLVTFYYRPPHLFVASLLSLGACAFLLVLLVVSLLRRRGPRVRATTERMSEQPREEVPERVG